MTLLHMDQVLFSYAHDHSDRSTEFRYDFTLERGKIIALTGPSGSGKSTLFDLIAGFLLPSSGRVVFDGRDVTHVLPGERHVSILFQKNNLFEHLSVFDNVRLGMINSGKSTSDQTDEALSLISAIGLSEFVNRRASALSGGQMQRVALAREMLRQTGLLLLDEPFNGLDEESRDQILPLLTQIVRQRNSSIILITHDLQSIEPITDGHLRMDDGCVNRVV